MNHTESIQSPPSKKWGRAPCLQAVLVAALFLSGCFSPSQANIQLRKDKQVLEEQVASLQSQLAADRARITTFEKNGAAAPSLPQQRLDRLYTVHELKIGRLSAGVDLDKSADGDEAFKLYLTPVDQEGDAIKSVGHLVIEAFDPLKSTNSRVGRWEFDPDKMKQSWRAFGLLEAFVLLCPLQAPLPHNQLNVTVTFVDDLTGRTLTQTGSIEIRSKTPPRPVAGN